MNAICGKYKRIRYKGIVCDRCGVEVTEKKVRRERMGHIQLVVPVAHIWYFRSLPNKIGYLFRLPTKKLDSIIYYERYVVIQPIKAEDIAEYDLLSGRRISGYSGYTSERTINIWKIMTRISSSQRWETYDLQFVGSLDRSFLMNCVTVQANDASQQRKNEALKRLAGC